MPGKVMNNSYPSGELMFVSAEIVPSVVVPAL
jgi:hypothetical protein